ncbi:MAG TPA: carboxypeptidase regulatory-like domain-containing protein [Terriglobia bacterium]|nr:carboxypeptidase regulatory-like domain-containing protein [Terriglobia bacterium]
MKTLILIISLLQVATQAQNDKGSVSGRVLSTDGKPAAGVRVAAVVAPEQGTGNPTNVTGGPTLLSLAQTDNEGSYRLENIPPGRYYITAGLVDLPTYYPGTRPLKAAGLFSSRPGR